MNRNGDWIQTYTGKKFYPLDPRPEDICIEDIAHALSNTCRYNGHSRTFYCVTPETLILTKNLTWVEAESLQLGQEIYSIEEIANMRKDKIRTRRKLIPAYIKHVDIIQRPCYEIELENGDILRASEDHPWLVATKASGNQKWMKCEEIYKSFIKGNVRYLPKFLNTWKEIQNKDIGWLAGIFDGEGHISFSCNQIGIGQKPGLVLNKIEKVLHDYFKEYTSYRCTHPESGTVNLYIRGEWAKKLEFLGRIQPIRLIDNLWKNITKRSHTAEAKELNKIISVKKIGFQYVVALETSSHTYFANGYAAHNSVAEHCVRMSLANLPGCPKWLLMHDAAEAYISDVPRPVKPMLEEFKAIENSILSVIGEKFNLGEMDHRHIKWGDLVMLSTEKRDVLLHDLDWNLNLPEPLIGIIRPMEPRMAEVLFYKRAQELEII